MRGTVTTAAIVCAGLFACSCGEGQKQPQKAAATETWLGEWVASVGDEEGNDTLVLNEDGTARMSPVGEEPATFNYKVESPEAWIKRRGLDAVPFGDTAELGPVTTIVTLTPTDREGEIPFYYFADLQLILLPFGHVYVRPGNEKRTSFRTDAGDGSHPLFDFLKPFEPIFADSETGDWAFSFKGDWRSILTQAAQELRAAGFEGPPVETTDAGLRGEAGTVIYYRSLDADKVMLAPNLRSERKNGEWVTHKDDGWISVHVGLLTPQAGK